MCTNVLGNVRDAYLNMYEHDCGRAHESEGASERPSGKKYDVQRYLLLMVHTHGLLHYYETVSPEQNVAVVDRCHSYRNMHKDAISCFVVLHRFPWNINS